MSGTKKAIVLGSDVNALGTIRDLSETGIKVIFLATKKHDPVFHSRFIHKRFKVPSPSDKSENLLNLMLTMKEDLDGAVLIPTNDASAVFVAKNRKALLKRYIPAIQDWDIIQKIIDKNLLYLHTQKVGVPSPKIFHSEKKNSLFQLKDRLTYPCLLKPCQKENFFEIYCQKALIAFNSEDYEQKLGDIQNHGIEVLVSEIIPGPVSRLFLYRSYLDNQGNVLAELTGQKIRQHPQDFGDGIVHKTIPLIPEIRELSLKLLRSLSFVGFSAVEFKHDIRDNQYKLIEINVRPVVGQRLFTKSGINFSHIIYLDKIGGKRVSSKYRAEVYFIHHFPDFWEFIRNIKSRELNLKEFFRPYRQKKKVFAVPFFVDPLPFIAFCWILLLNISKRLQKYLKAQIEKNH